jgi:hypothetical protein
MLLLTVPTGVVALLKAALLEAPRRLLPELDFLRWPVPIAGDRSYALLFCHAAVDLCRIQNLPVVPRGLLMLGRLLDAGALIDYIWKLGWLRALLGWSEVRPEIVQLRTERTVFNYA